jgi:hypothetical protein
MEHVYALSCNLGGNATRTVLTCAAMLNHHVDDCFPLQLGPLESDPPPKCTEITKCALGIYALVHSIVELPSKFQAYRVEDIRQTISHQIMTVGCKSPFRAVTTSDWTSARSIWRRLISDFSSIIVSAESLEPFLTKTIASCRE